MGHIEVFNPKCLTDQVQDLIDDSLTDENSYVRWFADTSFIRAIPAYKVNGGYSNIFNRHERISEEAIMLHVLSFYRGEPGRINIVNEIDNCGREFLHGLANIFLEGNIVAGDTVISELDRYRDYLARSRAIRQELLKEFKKKGIVEYKRENLTLVDELQKTKSDGITDVVLASAEASSDLRNAVNHDSCVFKRLENFLLVPYSHLKKKNGNGRNHYNISEVGYAEEIRSQLGLRQVISEHEGETCNPTVLGNDHKIIAEAILYSLAKAMPVNILTADGDFEQIIRRAGDYRKMFSDNVAPFIPFGSFNITIYFKKEPTDQVHMPIIIPVIKMDYYDRHLSISDIESPDDREWSLAHYDRQDRQPISKIMGIHIDY